MKCTELGDQWECDADRSPLCLTENWIDWYHRTKPNFPFEVYEVLPNNHFNKVKSYEDSMEEGMVFGWWDADEKFHIIKKWKNKSRRERMPIEVEKYLRKVPNEEVDNSLRNCGYISFEKSDKFYVYGEYHDSHYPTGY